MAHPLITKGGEKELSVFSNLCLISSFFSIVYFPWKNILSLEAKTFASSGMKLCLIYDDPYGCDSGTIAQLLGASFVFALATFVVCYVVVELGEILFNEDDMVVPFNNKIVCFIILHLSTTIGLIKWISSQYP